VPLYVMLPLDTVTILNTLNHVKARRGSQRFARARRPRHSQSPFIACF
jgi:hypothetical protein